MDFPDWIEIKKATINSIKSIMIVNVFDTLQQLH